MFVALLIYTQTNEFLSESFTETNSEYEKGA
jgi:hypothetical protein